jgi:hypothetical protein
LYVELSPLFFYLLELGKEAKALKEQEEPHGNALFRV